MANNADRPDNPKPSTPSSVEEELGFDPESPDLSDPQVDPVGPAIVPGDLQDTEEKKRERKDYDPLANLRR